MMIIIMVRNCSMKCHLIKIKFHCNILHHSTITHPLSFLLSLTPSASFLLQPPPLTSLPLFSILLLPPLPPSSFLLPLPPFHRPPSLFFLPSSSSLSHVHVSHRSTCWMVCTACIVQCCSCLLFKARATVVGTIHDLMKSTKVQTVGAI